MYWWGRIQYHWLGKEFSIGRLVSWMDGYWEPEREWMGQEVQTSQNMERLGIKGSALYKMSGDGKVCIHNACALCLYIRVPIAAPKAKPSLDTSPIIKATVTILVNSGFSCKSLVNKFATQKGFLDHATHVFLIYLDSMDPKRYWTIPKTILWMMRTKCAYFCDHPTKWNIQ